MEQISLVIPNYNRTNILLESFINVLSHPAICEVLVQDDDSANVGSVERMLGYVGSPKIRLLKNDRNLGTFFNKREAISHASNQWCILLDSDNIIDAAYVDRLLAVPWSKNAILAPQRLLHHPDNCLGSKERTFFDYASFVGRDIDFSFAARNWNAQHLPVLLNTGNFFVNREAYVEVFEINSFGREVDIADVAYFNYLFLKRDPANRIRVLPEQEYVHRVHPGSYYLNNSQLSGPANVRLKNLFENGMNA